jgi:hydrogenase maturation protease
MCGENDQPGLNPALILGYGNVDRQDDGVAWHVLAMLADRLGLAFPSSPEEEIQAGQIPDLSFVLQLTPELAETIAQFRYVCFVDAHTGNIEEDLRLVVLSSGFQASPFTHHMTPSTCLALAETLYGQHPQAILVSIRGYEFGFKRGLSVKTETLAKQAVDLILNWLRQASIVS